MNVIDRVESAKHTLTGSGLSKAISKATSHEIIGPKKKHVEYIQNALESGNVSLPDAADMLFERCSNSSWVVVFKSLVAFHHLMANANERFIQYVASKSTTWMLQTFLDKGGVQGYDMSHIVRRYSSYLSEKAFCYRSMGYDFCRAQRGRENGVVRNLDATKLLKALPAIQSLLDSLIATDISSNDLTNGVVTAAFMALFKDLIRLFACYNDGIINLLEKYFEMKKVDCKTGLELYRKFIARMERVAEFLKVAEDAGIDKGDIPDLTKAPNSLMDALESHYQSLEKGKQVTPPSKPMTIPTFEVSQTNNEKISTQSLSNFTPSESTSSDPSNDFLKEQQKMLELFEQKKREEAERESRLQQQSQQIPNALTPPQQTLKSTAQTSQQMQQPLFSNDILPPPKNSANDLLFLDPSLNSNANLFNNQASMSTNIFPQQAFGQASFNQQGNMNNFSQNLNFNTAFQGSTSKSTPNLMDDLLAPEQIHATSNSTATHNNNNNIDARLNGDLNKGLERVALSLDGLNVNPNLQKANTPKGHNWGPPPSNLKTGGANFQMQSVARSTLPPSHFGMGPNIGMTPMHPMYQNQYQPQMQAFGGIQQPNMLSNSYPMMQSQNMSGMYGGGMNPMMSGFTQQPMMSASSYSANQMNDPFK